MENLNENKHCENAECESKANDMSYKQNCGKEKSMGCKKDVNKDKKPTKVTKEEHDKIIENADRPVLIDFYATWCGPCQMLSPVIDEICGMRDDFIILKADVDDELELAQVYRVTSVPTLIMVDDGDILFQIAGFKPREHLLTVIDKALSDRHLNHREKVELRDLKKIGKTEARAERKLEHEREKMEKYEERAERKEEKELERMQRTEERAREKELKELQKFERDDEKALEKEEM